MQYAISMALYVVLNTCTCKDYNCNMELIRVDWDTVRFRYCTKRWYGIMPYGSRYFLFFYFLQFACRGRPRLSAAARNLPPLSPYVICLARATLPAPTNQCHLLLYAIGNLFSSEETPNLLCRRRWSWHPCKKKKNIIVRAFRRRIFPHILLFPHIQLCNMCAFPHILQSCPRDVKSNAAPTKVSRALLLLLR